MDIKGKIIKEFAYMAKNTARVISEMTDEAVGYGEVIIGGKKPFSTKEITCLCLGAERMFGSAWVICRFKDDTEVTVMNSKEWIERFPLVK